MRAVVQRVAEARITVEDESIARIGGGLCTLLGVAAIDTEADADYLCDKIIDLRLFDDATGKMNRSLREVGKCNESFRSCAAFLSPGSSLGMVLGLMLSPSLWSIR